MCPAVRFQASVELHLKRLKSTVADETVEITVADETV
jgi:hypothetical protein